MASLTTSNDNQGFNALFKRAIQRVKSQQNCSCNGDCLVYTQLAYLKSLQSQIDSKFWVKLWQIVNSSIIVHSNPILVVPIFSALVDGFKSQISIIPQSAFKHCLISYYNLLKNTNHFQTVLHSNILAIHYQLGDKTIAADLEWLGYIYELISSSFMKTDPPFIRKLLPDVAARSYESLHMLGNMLEATVSSRCTTQLVHGMSCPLTDIRLMYNNTPKGVKFSIGPKDMEWLSQITLPTYLETFKRHIKRGILTKSHKQQEDQEQQDYHTLLIILQIIQILSQLTFLGGYNSAVQSLLGPKGCQSLLEFLQISYLLYGKHNCGDKLTLNNVVFKSLEELLGQSVQKGHQSKNEDPTKTVPTNDYKSLPLKTNLSPKLFCDGQLPRLLRLLCNMAHINPKFHQYFEQSPHYLSIILSLTHSSLTQLTMREWAVIFIKNVVEGSPLLRDMVQKAQITMRVTQ